MWNTSAQPRKMCTNQRGHAIRLSDHAASVAAMRQISVLSVPTTSELR